MSQKKQEKTIKDPEITYETALTRIEEIAVILEDNNVSIDESMSLFEEALSLISFCDKKLKNIKQKISILTDDGKETEFNVDEQ